MSIVHKEERREGYMEMPKDFMLRVNAHVEAENGMFRTMRIVSSIFAALLAVSVWVFLEKNSDIKAMQQTLNEHSIQISKTLTILESQVEMNKAQQVRIDRTTDMMYDSKRK